MARFVIAPQWQGSGSSRAMQLVDGALAIAGDLPESACTRIDVPVEAGEALGTPIRRLSSLARVRSDVRDAARAPTGHTITIGGDCGVALGAIEAVAADDLAIVWIDAHADLHLPETSPSGAFHGMVLRAIIGEGLDSLRMPSGMIDPSKVVLAAVREFDEGEREIAAARGIQVLPPEDLSDPEILADVVARTGAARVFIHVDLDALDPADVSGVAFPVPFGPTSSEVIAAIRAVRARLPLAGATITEFAPSSPGAAIEDLPTVLRVIGALA